MSFEVLSEGHVLVEGPRPDPSHPPGVLFSDVVAGWVHRWTPDGTVATVLPARRGVGGLVPHAGGGVVVTGRDVRHDDALLLGAPPGVTGFNDLVTDDAGGVLVGALRFRPMAGEAPVPGELWRIPPGDPAAHPPHVVLGGLLWPNGVGLSPDGATLYVSDFAAGEVVAADAHGGGRRTFARVPAGAAPDGLAVDAEGGVWVALGRPRRSAGSRPTAPSTPCSTCRRTSSAPSPSTGTACSWPPPARCCARARGGGRMARPARTDGRAAERDGHRGLAARAPEATSATPVATTSPSGVVKGAIAVTARSWMARAVGGGKRAQELRERPGQRGDDRPPVLGRRRAERQLDLVDRDRLEARVAQEGPPAGSDRPG